MLQYLANLKNKHLLALSAIVSVFHTVLGIFSSSIITRNNSSIDANAQYGSSILVSLFFGLSIYLLLLAAVNVFSYAHAIFGSVESKAFSLIGLGLLVLTLSIVITSFLNLFRLPFTVSATDYGLLTVAIYYAAGYMSFIYLALIGLGGRSLAKYVHKQKSYYVFLFLAIVIMLFASNALWDERIVQSVFNIDHVLAYVESDIAFYSVYVLVVLGWALAFTSIFGISVFQAKTNSKIYTKGLIRISTGIMSLVLVSSIRHLSDYLYGSFSYTTLSTDVFRVILLLSIVMFSALSINSGVSKLKKIEAVT